MINIIKDNIRGNAYCLLPENFLYAMVLSEEDNVRSQGLRIILRLKNIREENSEEDLAEKRIQNILGDAGHWAELINLEDFASLREPATTRHLSNEDLFNYLTNKTLPDLPTLPSHSQSVERSVRLVSEASKCVYGFDNRHKSIMTKIVSRKSRPKFSSNGFYVQMYDDIFWFALIQFFHYCLNK